MKAENCAGSLGTLMYLRSQYCKHLLGHQHLPAKSRENKHSPIEISSNEKNKIIESIFIFQFFYHLIMMLLGKQGRHGILKDLICNEGKKT